MKKKLIAAFALFLLAALHSALSVAHGQGTAFTYQGLLIVDDNPANGDYDLTFTLFGTNSGGGAIAGPITNAATGVSSGLFTTTIDFGPGVATGAGYWLEIAARTNGSESFSTLAPRQLLTPAPYAITAENLAGVSQNNSITPGQFATVGGGQDNVSSGYEATVGGGLDNTSSNDFTTVAGGIANAASGFSATVCGGYGNTASGGYSTVCGGLVNIAAGQFSFAGGVGAQALHDGSFVWADDTGGNYASTAVNQFSVRASGGVRFNAGGGSVQFNTTGGITLAGDMHLGTSSADYHHFSIGGGNSYGYIYGSYPGLGDGINMGYNWYADASGTGHVINTGGATSLITAGYGLVALGVGGVNGPPAYYLYVTTSGVKVEGTFDNESDRNKKQDFAPISDSQILDKVAQLPVCEWSYKVDSKTRHVGPMAQDFYAAFNIGTDEKHIAPIDEGGVALAAIQGLNRKLEDQAKQKDAEIRDLNARLERLEQLVAGKKGGAN